MGFDNSDEIQYDQDKIDEITLALIYLNVIEAGGAWKGIPWSATDRLHDKGYIFNPRSKGKSLTLTGKGRIRAKELFLKHFTNEEVISTDFPNAIVLNQNNEKDYILNISLHQLEYAFEQTNWKRQFFLNLETGEIEESFASALVDGVWLAIPGYTSTRRNRSSDEAQAEISVWLAMNQITLANQNEMPLPSD